MITVHPTNTDFLRPNDCIDIYALRFLLCTGRWIKQSEKLAAEAEQPDLTPKLDLSFKEGQTIHINLGVSITSSGTTADWEILPQITYCANQPYLYMTKK